jgi:hypothetical protein
VEDVDLASPQQTGQAGMMPGDVLDGWTEPFGHRDEFELVLSEGEEGEILFEDKKDELMVARLHKQGANQRQHVLADAGAAALDD